MFLNCSILGGDASLITAIPPKQQYTSTKFYGEIEIDNFQSLNYELTDEEIIAITTKAGFTDNTIMLADFENSLEAGNFSNFDMPITHWRIYRKKSNELIYKLLKEIPRIAGNNYYIDYSAQSNESYNYQIYPVSNEILGNPIGGVGIVAFDYGWILCDEDEDIVYKFDIELETSDIQTLKDFHIYENYSSYPAFSFGKKNYREGSITTMPLDIENNDYVSKLETLESLRSFINDGNVKILKNSFGEIFKVITHSATHKYMDSTLSHPKISFKFTEVGSV